MRRPRAVPTATGSPRAAASAVQTAGAKPSRPCKAMPAATSVLQVSKGRMALLNPDQVLYRLELGGTDAGHLEDVRDVAERPPRLAILDDPARQGGPDARKAFQLRRLGEIDVETLVRAGGRRCRCVSSRRRRCIGTTVSHRVRFAARVRFAGARPCPVIPGAARRLC